MFLVRTAFWLLIVLAFLPVDRPADENQLPVSPIAALSAAQQTFTDLAGFCGRNSSACETGRETAKLIGDRAQTGAKAVYHYLVDKSSDTVRPASDTLSKSDRLPEWAMPRKGAENS